MTAPALDDATRALLRDSPLLASCGPAQLERVLGASSETTLAPGEPLFGEDDRPDAVWVVLDGDVVVTKAVDDDELVLDRLHPGDYLGEVQLLTDAPAQHQARTKQGARLLRIPGETFRDLIHRCDGVMATVVRTLAGRMRHMEQLLQQRERMAGLGTIAAGLAHELNNPAAAANRASSLLRAELDGLDALARRLMAHDWSEAELHLLDRLASRGAPDAAADADPLERSDREEALADWLAEHGVEHGGELAPALAERGVTAADLQAVAHGCEAAVVADALTWTERIATLRRLLDELTQGTARIRELVGAVKAYSYLDATTLRTADVHEGLDQSLTILGHKLREARVTVARDYDRALPPLETYGTELTQVWTNLVDNAVDALAGADGARTVRVGTHGDGDAAVVEIADSGPGIPEEVRARMFDPFFTTKPAGRGTGLGLQIAKRVVLRHGGTIEVASAPGDTRVRVRLPLRQVAAPPPSG